jgi:hypothetical protein
MHLPGISLSNLEFTIVVYDCCGGGVGGPERPLHFRIFTAKYHERRFVSASWLEYEEDLNATYDGMFNSIYQTNRTCNEM